MRATRSWYGNVQIPRIYCSRCRTWAMVVRGVRQCCDYETEVEYVKVRRMVNPEAVRRRPPLKARKLLLEQYRHACAYCERIFGDWTLYHGEWKKILLAWDHQIPFVHNQNNQTSNFLPSCRVCNGWKSDKIFQTLEEVKVYVALRWQEDRERHPETVRGVS